MGMFDTIHMDGSGHELKCRNGHALPNDLQTKAWDRNLDNYFLKDGVLHVRRWWDDERGAPKEQPVKMDGLETIEAISGRCRECGEWTGFKIAFDTSRVIDVRRLRRGGDDAD